MMTNDEIQALIELIEDEINKSKTMLDNARLHNGSTHLVDEESGCCRGTTHLGMTVIAHLKKHLS